MFTIYRCKCATIDDLFVVAAAAAAAAVAFVDYTYIALTNTHPYTHKTTHTYIIHTAFVPVPNHQLKIQQLFNDINSNSNQLISTTKLKRKLINI